MTYHKLPGPDVIHDELVRQMMVIADGGYDAEKQPLYLLGLQIQALLLVGEHLDSLAEYVGALQENLQHIDDALNEANKENM